MQVESKWHGADFKKLCHGNAKQIILRLAVTVEKLTKLNMASIYDRPQRGNYKRTGAARASVHWEYKEHEVAVYIGSDIESLNKARRAAGAGSSIFYFIFLEKGYHTRKGRFIQGHWMLTKALDTLKRGLR